MGRMVLHIRYFLIGLGICFLLFLYLTFCSGGLPFRFHLLALGFLFFFPCLRLLGSLLFLLVLVLLIFFSIEFFIERRPHKRNRAPYGSRRMLIGQPFPRGHIIRYGLEKPSQGADAFCHNGGGTAPAFQGVLDFVFVFLDRRDKFAESLRDFRHHFFRYGQKSRADGISQLTGFDLHRGPFNINPVGFFRIQKPRGLDAGIDFHQILILFQYGDEGRAPCSKDFCGEGFCLPIFLGFFIAGCQLPQLLIQGQ